MALITSHTGQEALNFQVGDMQYGHYTGGFNLEISCSVLNPALPEQAHEIGQVWTGPKLAQSLREFDFSAKAFHYAYDFNWENDSDNAGWWIRKPARRATVDVEFVFLRAFHWITEGEDEEEDEDEEEEEEEDEEGDEEGDDPLQWAVEEVLEYMEPIHAAKAHFPSLKLIISADDPVKRNGVIGCIGSPKAKVRRVIASASDDQVLVESRVRVTAERAEFDRFIEVLQQEIHAAEQEFFKTHPKYAPKVVDTLSE